jgi:hypothetical protein
MYYKRIAYSLCRYNGSSTGINSRVGMTSLILGFCSVHVAQSLVFCEVFYVSLFVFFRVYLDAFLMGTVFRSDH